VTVKHDPTFRYEFHVDSRRERLNAIRALNPTPEELKIARKGSAAIDAHCATYRDALRRSIGNRQ